MPQSPWEQASAAIQGVGENMNHVAFQVAQIKYQRALAEQRMAIAMAHQAMQGQMQRGLMEKNSALAKAADARTALDRIRGQASQRQQQVASQLGGAEFARQMPDVSGVEIGDQNTDWKGIQDQANMAKIRSALMESRALAGKSSDPYATHNVPQGNEAIDMGGNVIGVGQPKPEAPIRLSPGQVAFDRSGQKIASVPDRPATGRSGAQINPASLYNSLARYAGSMDAPPNFLQTNDLARVSHDLTMQELQRQLQARTNVVSDAGPDSAQAPTNPPVRLSEPATNTPAGNAGKKLDPKTASDFLEKAGGDKDKARQLAREAGYTF